jgi:methylenetetrahydrofolate reductase (NADPH)
MPTVPPFRVSQAYGPGKFGLSFELFPPKNAEGEASLFEHLRELVSFRPSFITCTYGAGGSTRDKTLDIVTRVRREFQCPVASHLTCVGSVVDDLRSYLRDAQARGVDNIVALRGDPPKGETEFKPIPGGLRYANDLVKLIRQEFPGFGVAVAGYPETHQEAESADSDLANLKRKVESGGDIVITQLFYDNDDFFRFRERYDAAGIKAPLVPGLLPITNFAQVKRITALCGAKLPAPLVSELEKHGDDAGGQFETGVAACLEQVRGLLAADVPGIHFYVLNKSQATARILREAKIPHAT